MYGIFFDIVIRMKIVNWEGGSYKLKNEEVVFGNVQEQLSKMKGF
jgi:hypothetical protein